MATEVFDAKIDEIDALIKDLPKVLELPDLIKVYKKVLIIAEIEKALAKQILVRLKAGEKSPEYKLVRTRGRSSVIDPETLSRRLANYVVENAELGLDIFDILEPKSVTKLREYIDPEPLGDLLDGLISDGKVGKDYDFAPHEDTRPEVIYTKE